MRTTQKTMTAFRIEPGIMERMKARARNLNISVNRYITNLIVEDLNENSTLPKASMTVESRDFAKRYAGIIENPSSEELQNDEQLRAIWER